MTPDSSVRIVGFAAATSLGYALEPTLAAMGAGLSNFSDSNINDQAGQPAVCAPLPVFDPDTARDDRFTTLLELGVQDLERLLQSIGVESAPAFVGLPADADTAERNLVHDALQESRFVVPGPRWDFAFGRASGFAALNAAIKHLRSGDARIVVVGGVDSLCAPTTLRALVDAERVLCPGTEGTIPGEAAAFVVLANADHPASAYRTAATLERVSLQRSAVAIQTAEQVHPDGLASTFRKMREAGAERVDRIIAAHSGEGYFGRCFSHAYLREIELMPEPLSVELIADCVGDVGAAAAVLGMAFAHFCMVKDEPEEPGRALIYTESDAGETGAAIIEGARNWQRPVDLSVAQ